MNLVDDNALPPVLDASHAEFIQHHVSINIASRDPDNLPSVSRALGCRVSADRRQVTVFIPRSRSSKLLKDIVTSCSVAVVFSRPSTHETLQLKGEDAVVSELQSGDRRYIEHCKQQFVEELSKISYSTEFATAVISQSNDEAIAVTFTPSAAFVQTPGPGAGERLLKR